MPEYKEFAEWIAQEIFDANWDFNYAAIAELACRKLYKLGVIGKDGENWTYNGEGKPLKSYVDTELIVDSLNTMRDGECDESIDRIIEYIKEFEE